MTPHNDALARRGARFGFLAAASSGPGQTYFIGLFGAFLREDFALTDATLGALYGIATLSSGLLMFWLGELADRLALRRAISLAVFLVVGGCVLIASAPAAPVMGLGLFLLRLGGQGLAGHFAIVAAARFGGAKHGRGIATASMGFLLGEAIYPSLVTAALGLTDWRTVWLLSALALLTIFVPVLRRLATSLPFAGAAAAATGVDEIDWNRRKLAVSAPFLSTLGVVLVPSFVVTAIFFHQSTLAGKLGWVPPQVARAFILFAVCQGLGMLLAGRLIDRFTARALLPYYLLPLAGGLMATVSVSPQVALWLLFGGVGLSAGCNSVVGGAIWVEVFGIRKLGLIRGVYAATMVTMTAASPVLLGMLLSSGANLATIFAPVIAYAVVVPALLAPLTRRGHARGRADTPV